MKRHNLSLRRKTYKVQKNPELLVAKILREEKGNDTKMKLFISIFKKT